MKFLSLLNSYVTKILFPPRCVSCKKEGAFLCDSCIKNISLKPQTYKENPFEDNSVKVLYTSCDYHSNKILQKAIHGLKYKYYKDIAQPLAKILQKSFYQNQPPQNTHLVPIPLHKKRKRFRGFNQAQLLAEHLSKLTKYPVTNLLERKINTVSQATLNRKQRLSNMQGSFIINKKYILQKNTPIMLVDDICTTLSTFKVASQTLQKHGYKIILCTALAQA